jgi:glyoxylase-like metal-dependent hydrolase (beta-lactamase superfamily II)
MASTLIYGREEAVLTDPGMTFDQARALGDWVAEKGKNLTDIFVTHGHRDHWFAAGILAERFGARVVAGAGTIAEMGRNVAMRPLLWDKVYPGLIPPSPVTAVPVPDNRFTVEGHDLVIVEVGPTDAVDSTVLHVPDLDLRRRRCDLQRRAHVPRPGRACRRLRAVAGGDRQGRGVAAAADRRRSSE